MKTKHLVAGLLTAFLAGVPVGIAVGLWLTDQPIPTEFSCAAMRQPLAVLPPFDLTPAPAGETPLQRWKRTKSDFERAAEIEREAAHTLEQNLTLRAIAPYGEAERELQATQCDKICAPGGEPR